MVIVRDCISRRSAQCWPVLLRSTLSSLRACFLYHLTFSSPSFRRKSKSQWSFLANAYIEDLYWICSHFSRYTWFHPVSAWCYISDPYSACSTRLFDCRLRSALSCAPYAHCFSSPYSCSRSNSSGNARLSQPSHSPASPCTSTTPFSTGALSAPAWWMLGSLCNQGWALASWPASWSRRWSWDTTRVRWSSCAGTPSLSSHLTLLFPASSSVQLSYPVSTATFRRTRAICLYQMLGGPETKADSYCVAGVFFSSNLARSDCLTVRPPLDTLSAFDLASYCLTWLDWPGCRVKCELSAVAAWSSMKGFLASVSASAW